MARAVRDVVGTKPRLASDEVGADDQSDAFDFVPTSEYGRRLLELRNRAIAAGQPLLTREELEREIMERRGGVAVEPE